MKPARPQAKAHGARGDCGRTRRTAGRGGRAYRDAHGRGAHESTVWRWSVTTGVFKPNGRAPFRASDAGLAQGEQGLAALLERIGASRRSSVAKAKRTFGPILQRRCARTRALDVDDTKYFLVPPQRRADMMTVIGRDDLAEVHRDDGGDGVHHLRISIGRWRDERLPCGERA